LSEILDTLEQLRMDFADYIRLAGQEDADYKVYSPWYNHDQEATVSIDFDIDKTLPFVAASSFLSKLPRIWTEGKAKMRQAGVASRWALWDAKKLENTVEKFRKRNAKLKEVLQIATATQQQGTSDALEMLLNDEDAKTLGLTAHAEIRQLVVKPGNNDMDFSLKNAILVSDAETTTIHTGTCKTSAAKGNTATESVLIEYKDYPPILGGLEHSEIVKMQSNLKTRINQLAGLLSSSGSNKLGTLPFKGLVDQPSKSRHAFVFYFPADADISSPESLHSVIETPSSNNLWPLAARFKIAQDLARSIGAFHADGWVHKSVRSQSIAFFKHRSDKKLLLDSPYLVDFEYSRPESGSTLLLRDNNDEKNLYRHPEIQDVARSSFSKVHDLYSLGVVLLEISLWQTARTMLKRTGLEPGAINPIGLQKMYIDRTKKRVAHLMGASYQSAVLACLESKYKDHTRRYEFPMIFHEEVTQKLSVRGII
jgi:serine/threonine protein kinase